MTQRDLADQLEAALNLIDDPDVVCDPTTPNLARWPGPGVRREFAEWLAARVTLPAKRHTLTPEDWSA